MVLEAFWYNHFAIFTEYVDVFNQLGGVAFPFSLCYEVMVLLLCFSYLSGGERIDGVFFVSIRFMGFLLLAMDGSCCCVELW